MKDMKFAGSPSNALNSEGHIVLLAKQATSAQLPHANLFIMRQGDSEAKDDDGDDDDDTEDDDSEAIYRHDLITQHARAIFPSLPISLVEKCLSKTANNNV